MVRRRPVEEMSQRPEQIRVRLRRGKGNYEQDLAMYAKVSPHMKPLDQWDLEELARGKPRDKNGGFSGRRPGWITIAVLEEAKRRLIARTYEEVGSQITTAVKVIHDLMVSEETDHNGKPIVDARTKLAAAQFIIEHTIGKPKALVELNDGGSQQRKAIAAAIVEDDGLPQGHLGEPIEGEIVEEDEDVE